MTVWGCQAILSPWGTKQRTCQRSLPNLRWLQGAWGRVSGDDGAYTTEICPATRIERLVASARTPGASSPSICNAQPLGSDSWTPLTRVLSSGQKRRKGRQYRDKTRRAKCHGRVIGVISNMPSLEDETAVNGAPPAYDGTLLTITTLAPGGIAPVVQPFSSVSSCQDRLGKRVEQYRKASMA